MKVKNLFTGRTDKELKIRNIVLNIIRVPIWGIAIIGAIRMFCTVEMAGTSLIHLSMIEWIISILSILLLIRFEFWAMHFFGRFFCRSGQDWAVSGLKDNHVFQTKFFTGKQHNRGDKNPLW